MGRRGISGYVIKGVDKTSDKAKLHAKVRGANRSRTVQNKHNIRWIDSTFWEIKQ